MAGRILVLDDEENYAAMLQDLLRENNYSVDMATKPERAIVQLEDIPYDLVISDYKMPVMDGSDFLKKARELYPNLPFILVSGLMNTPELVKVANMSVTLVMEKPLDTEVFLGHVARFSKPMTEEEKAAQQGDEAAPSDAVAIQALPQKPSLFSAENFLAERFLQQAWASIQNKHALYVRVPQGSDCCLALKEFSQWLGWGDRPIFEAALPESYDEALALIRQVLADEEKSRLVGFRLQSIAGLANAHRLTAEMQATDDESESCVLVYMLPDDVSAEAFKEATDGRGISLPPIAVRPSDLATYIRRFARLSEERNGQDEPTRWTAEAKFALLSYEWPSNYGQLQEVIPALINADSDQPISLDVVCDRLGRQIEVPSAEERLPALMRAQQARFLEALSEEDGLTLSEIATNLELSETVQTKDDLKNLPLVDSEFGQLESSGK